MELTELQELFPDRIDGVETPATGVEFLMLKAAASGQTHRTEGDALEDFDRAVLSEALSKASQGIPLPAPGSPDRSRLDAAVTRQQGRGGLPQGARGDSGFLGDIAHQIAQTQVNVAPVAGRAPQAVFNPREGGDDSERARPARPPHGQRRHCGLRTALRRR